jgi:hypothetical protein
MRAAVYLSLGELETSKCYMNECLNGLEAEGLDQSSLQRIANIFIQAIHFPSQDQITFCSEKFEQPTGVKIKYCLGVGQIIAGILAIPFSGGISSGLIFSGTSMTIDAVATAIDNKEAWERSLDERRRHYPN